MPESAFVRFPQPANRDGLVLLDGRLTPEWMLSAYRQGVFPWPIVDAENEQVAWFSPDPRAILPLNEFHVSRRLRRRLRRGEFELTLNESFDEVVEQCARSRGDGVWLTQAMAEAYRELRALGHAHSVEAWRGGELAGGVLGIALGGLFSAESMFHHSSNAGNAALAELVVRLSHSGFALVDVQQASRHMSSLGAIEVSRAEYLAKLSKAICLDVELQ
jgi:leucyl/phenylalanyl-tRNA--protein transferase